MKLYFRIRLMQLVSPYVWGTVGVTLGILGTSLAAIVSGIPEATDRIATEWMVRAMNQGNIPPLWSDTLYWIFRTIAFLIIALGWIFLAHLTVWITRILF